MTHTHNLRLTTLSNKVYCTDCDEEWLPKEQRNTTPEPKPDLPLEAMYGFSQEQWDILRRLWYTPETYTKAEVDLELRQLRREIEQMKTAHVRLVEWMRKL